MKLKKKTAIIAMVALLVCAAAYLNWSWRRGQSVETGGAEIVSDEERLLGDRGAVLNGKTPAAVPTAVEEYFANLRLSRREARDEAISVLELTSEDESLSAESRQSALASINLLANNAVIEARIESLVLSKGYADCAAFLNSDSLSIVVAPPEGGLQTEDAVRIKDIAVAESSVALEKIRIIEARVGGES
ncbi:MAG: SpoIIIAH-like family protein [Oscillospiraceae bacterium]|nr:SpoIIIAH-like family protein [Oscillospiraceae bacterium]